MKIEPVKQKSFIRQLMCPILGTWYLCGGYVFGHRWRNNDVENHIYCRECGKRIEFLKYKDL